HVRDADFDSDRWELYHLDSDFSETHDLAADHPEKLASMIDEWWSEAEKNSVLPLDDRGFAQRSNANFKPHSPRDRKKFVYLRGMTHLPNAAAPPVPGRSFEISTVVERPTGTEDGVLIA